MNNRRKRQLNIKLPHDIYGMLKDKCDAESLGVQDYLVDMIVQNVTHRSSLGELKSDEKDEKFRILNIINKCPILKDGRPAELKDLANSATYHRYEKGRIVVWEEEVCNSFKIVAEGLLKIFKTSSTGKESIIDFIGQGESFGELTVISGISSPYFIGAQALENTGIISIPKEALQAFYFRNPQAISRLFSLSMKRSNAMIERLSSLGTEKAGQRVIKTLNELSGKFGNRISLNHKEIAGMSATTQETVSRVLNALQHRSVVKLSRGEMIIVDKDKLLADPFSR